MKRLLIVSFCLTCACSVRLATAATWTGAGENGCWTNSANWVEGIIPGQYYDADGNQPAFCDFKVVRNVSLNMI